MCNCRIIYDNGKWYFGYVYKFEKQEFVLTDKPMGIDLGVKKLITTSFDGKCYQYGNINKSNKIKKLEKRLSKYMTDLNRKTINNSRLGIDNGYNFEINRKKLINTHRKIVNIRKDYICKVVCELINLRPNKIVMEDLNIQGMIKNKVLAKSIIDSNFRYIRNRIESKCKTMGIEFVLADTFYPSSKICHNCGNLKKDLKLKDRIYNCDICGVSIDRDYNAALNLMNY